MLRALPSPFSAKVPTLRSSKAYRAGCPWRLQGATRGDRCRLAPSYGSVKTRTQTCSCTHAEWRSMHPRLRLLLPRCRHSLQHLVCGRSSLLAASSRTTQTSRWPSRPPSWQATKSRTWRSVVWSTRSTCTHRGGSSPRPTRRRQGPSAAEVAILRHRAVLVRISCGRQPRRSQRRLHRHRRRHRRTRFRLHPPLISLLAGPTSLACRHRLPRRQILPRRSIPVLSLLPQPPWPPLHRPPSRIWIRWLAGRGGNDR
jgi:hypothetical protein